MSDFLQEICPVCNHKRGLCQPMSDTGKLLLPIWKVLIGGQEILTHELPEDNSFKTTYRVILPDGYKGKIRYIDNTGENQ
jgi:hypothetical protein